MNMKYLNRIFICSLLYICITIVVYLNNSLKIVYSSTPLLVKSSNYVSLEHYNASQPLQLKSPTYVPSFKYYIKTTFVETSDNIFVLGAAARNATIGKSWSEYVVYGQIYRRIVPSEQLSCCLRYTNGSVIKVNIIRDFKGVMSNVRLSFFHVTCLNPMGSYENSKTMPEGIALINNASSCQRSNFNFKHLQFNIISASWYICGFKCTLWDFPCTSKTLKFIKLSYILRQGKGSFAINSKIAHGNLDSNSIINWIETYRVLGATKICACAYTNLNKDARKVLEYYSSTGFIDLYTIELANIDKEPRDIYIQDKQTATDQILFAQHMFELHRGYYLYAAIDWDEFIIPKKNISLRDLALRILDKHKQKSIMFKSQFYIKEDSRSTIENNISLLPLSAYRRTLPKAEINRPKSIYKPVDIDMAFVHRVFPKKYETLGKQIYICPTSKAKIYHCRQCIPSDDPNICVTNPDTVMDNKLAKWSERNLKNKVLDVHSKLKLKDYPKYMENKMFRV